RVIPSLIAFSHSGDRCWVGAGGDRARTAHRSGRGYQFRCVGLVPWLRRAYSRFMARIPGRPRLRGSVVDTGREKRYWSRNAGDAWLTDGDPNADPTTDDEDASPLAAVG